MVIHHGSVSVTIYSGDHAPRLVRREPDRAIVHVRAGIAKTAARRLVPLSDAAIAWLRPLAQGTGRLAYYSQENKFYLAIVSAVNRSRAVTAKPEFIWKRNGLRHSFCSYRLAVTHDAAKVALEAGNSPTMIFRHYRELVTEDQGKAWFAISPRSPGRTVAKALLSALPA